MEQVSRSTNWTGERNTIELAPKDAREWEVKAIWPNLIRGKCLRRLVYGLTNEY